MSVHNKIRHKIDILLLLLVLPLAGLIAAGLPVTMAHLEFPPLTQYVRHAGFSWPVFCFLAFSIAVAVGPFLLKSFRSRSRPIPDAPGSGKPFPWWGWAGLALTACVWVLAWTRFPWFEPFQPLLQVLAVAVMVWAIWQRWTYLDACPTPRTAVCHRSNGFRSHGQHPPVGLDDFKGVKGQGQVSQCSGSQSGGNRP